MNAKKIASVLLTLALLVSLSIPSQIVSAKSTLLCKDERIEVYYKQSKNGKIYLNQAEYPHLNIYNVGGG